MLLIYLSLIKPLQDGGFSSQRVYGSQMVSRPTPAVILQNIRMAYKLIISGASLGLTPIQEALILDPEGIPVARDTKDIRTASED